MMNRIKFWFFRNYWWIFLIGLIILLLITFINGSGHRWKIFASIFPALVTGFFFVQKQRLEELKLFNELFTKFNKRYDELNEKINAIYNEDSEDELTKKQVDTLYDYFNLCGEEYFYYNQSYIYPQVWKAWINGMKYYYKNARIGKKWKEELEQNSSYYGFTKDLLESP